MDVYARVVDRVCIKQFQTNYRNAFEYFEQITKAIVYINMINAPLFNSFDDDSR